MADQLYLSLWFPNFRLEALPATLVSVLRQFATVSGDKRVAAASAIPIGFNESPTYQRIYVNDPRAEENVDTSASAIESAVAEATEQLHDDMAYEFEMKWQLWTPEGSTSRGARTDDNDLAERQAGSREVRSIDGGRLAAFEGLDTLWKLEPHTIRVLGFGPEFDDAGFEQNGHLRVDFGLDTPWVLEDLEIDEDPDVNVEAQKRIKENVEKLLAFTLLVEKHCNISSRLLWTESGEPLAEKLIAQLQRLN